MHSKLSDLVHLSPNYSKGRTHEIDTITPHCYVGQVTAERIGNGFANPATQASCNYGIALNGKKVTVVEEENRSWCTGGKRKVGVDKNGNPIYQPIYVNGISGAMNDQRAITIEIACDKTYPYAITDAAYESLIELLVDICQRYPKLHRLKWKGDKSLVGKPEEQNITVHRWFANKECPGDYIYERLGKIADEVNRRLDELENIKDGDDDEMKVLYNTYDEVPTYYQEAIKYFTDNGYLKGDGNGALGLSEDMCRILTVMYRVMKK